MDEESNTNINVFVSKNTGINLVHLPFNSSFESKYVTNTVDREYITFTILNRIISFIYPLFKFKILPLIQKYKYGM